MKGIFDKMKVRLYSENNYRKVSKEFDSAGKTNLRSSSKAAKG